MFERLSAARIAETYGLKYASTKTAESTILYHLKKNGVDRRDKAEHIRKTTAEIVDGWVKRYEAGESLKEIAAEDLSPVTVWLHLRKRGVSLRNKVEAQIQAVTKYERRPFDGDRLEREYLKGLKMGDLNAVRHGRAVRVKVSTTHPAMVELFSSIFGKYGYVQKYPRRTALTGFEWSLECDLDSSFDFLLYDDSPEVLAKSESEFLAFLAGFFDADGSIYYHKKRWGGGFEFSLANLDESLLRAISTRMVAMGLSPRLRRDRQSRDRGVKNGGDFIWRLSLWRYAEVVQLLGKLPIRHREKKTKSELVRLLGYRASASDRMDLLTRWRTLLNSIRQERDDCVKQASEALPSLDIAPRT